MNCITIQHCIVRQWAGEMAVSRYNYCIVTEVGQALDAGLGSRCGAGALGRRRACWDARASGKRAGELQARKARWREAGDSCHSRLS